MNTPDLPPGAADVEQQLAALAAQARAVRARHAAESRAAVLRQAADDLASDADGLDRRPGSLDNNFARGLRHSAAYLRRCADAILGTEDRPMSDATTIQPDSGAPADLLQLIVAHDRQSYPTAWAYQQACKALEVQRERADQAEADAKRWLAFIERGMETHMQFSVQREDGTLEQLPCADWCYACRIEKAEGVISRVRALLPTDPADDRLPAVISRAVLRDALTESAPAGPQETPDA